MHGYLRRGWIGVHKSANPTMFSPNPSIRQYFRWNPEPRFLKNFFGVDALQHWYVRTFFPPRLVYARTSICSTKGHGFEPFGLNYRPEDIALVWKFWDDKSIHNPRKMENLSNRFAIWFCVWKKQKCKSSSLKKLLNMDALVKLPTIVKNSTYWIGITQLQYQCRGKVSVRAKWHQTGAYPGFCSMKRPGVFLLPPGVGC